MSKTLSSKVSVGSGHSAPTAPSTGTGPSNTDTSVKGFGSGKAHGSTINAVGGQLDKALPAPGASVRGFSGSGALKGKI
jgi:hypothetical protein